MNQKDAEILGKIMEIARLKKEIVQAIVPEKTYKHLEVIGNEFKALLTDLISESACKYACDCKAECGAECKAKSDQLSEGASKHQSKVKKVDID